MAELHSSNHRFGLPPAHESPPDWIDEVLEQIRRLSNLPANWDSYGASPPNQQSLHVAENFIKGLSLYVGVLKPEVSLTANGNAAFLWEWQEGSRNLDLEVLADGTINYAYADEEDESRDQEGRTQDGLKIVNILTQW